jgi:hypothetical protein
LKREGNFRWFLSRVLAFDPSYRILRTRRCNELAQLVQSISCSVLSSEMGLAFDFNFWVAIRDHVHSPGPVFAGPATSEFSQLFGLLVQSIFCSV